MKQPKCRRCNRVISRFCVEYEGSICEICEPPVKWKFCTAQYLKKCALWEGSDLHTDFRYSGIGYEKVVRDIARMEKLDDLTPNEVQWLEALRRTRDDPAGNAL